MVENFVEEEDEEDESTGVQFRWDPVKGELVPICSPDAAQCPPKEETSRDGEIKAADEKHEEAAASSSSGGREGAPQASTAGAVDEEPTTSHKNPEAMSEDEDDGGETDDAEDDEEDDEEEEEEEEEGLGRVGSEGGVAVDMASTPELIKMSVTMGGSMAASVTNKWIFDQKTTLWFHYSKDDGRICCWNGEQGSMYEWKGRGVMNYLWASKPSLKPPPLIATTSEDAASSSSTPNAAATGDGQSDAASVDSSSQKDAEGKVDAVEAKVEEGKDKTVLWLTVMPPGVLNPWNEESASKGGGEEVIELPRRALGSVIGKGGSNLKKMRKATGAKITADNNDKGAHALVTIRGPSQVEVSNGVDAVMQTLAAVPMLGMQFVDKLRKKRDDETMQRLKKETAEDAAGDSVKGLKGFVQQHKVGASVVRKMKKLDVQFLQYVVRHFRPLGKAKAQNALKKYTVALLRHPQRWRLQGLYEDGHIDSGLADTVPVPSTGAMVGRALPPDAARGEQDEQLVELDLETLKGMTEKDVTRYYGDVMEQHCRVMQLGGQFYAYAQESRVGTIVDGNKIRQTDGPTPLRDGSTIEIGKFLLYCEIGDPMYLQQRRERLQRGEGMWNPQERQEKVAVGGKGETPVPEAGTPTDVKEEGEMATNAAKTPASPEEEEEEDDDEDEDEGKSGDEIFESVDAATAAVESRKRKRDEAGIEGDEEEEKGGVNNVTDSGDATM